MIKAFSGKACTHANPSRFAIDSTYIKLNILRNPPRRVLRTSLEW